MKFLIEMVFTWEGDAEKDMGEDIANELIEHTVYDGTAKLCWTRTAVLAEEDNDEL